MMHRHFFPRLPLVRPSRQQQHEQHQREMLRIIEQARETRKTRGTHGGRMIDPFPILISKQFEERWDDDGVGSDHGYPDHPVWPRPIVVPEQDHRPRIVRFFLRRKR